VLNISQNRIYSPYEKPRPEGSAWAFRFSKPGPGRHQAVTKAWLSSAQKGSAQPSPRLKAEPCTSLIDALIASFDDEEVDDEDLPELIDA
jgi:hypothetical protein